MIRVICVALFVIALGACQRIPRNYAGTKAPNDQPKYQVQLDPHDSAKRGS